MGAKCPCGRVPSALQQNQHLQPIPLPFHPRPRSPPPQCPPVLERRGHGCKWDDRTLRRIAALLVALAVLAERAAGQSFPVRFVLLCILRQAESVALSLVAETIQDGGTCFEDDPETGYGSVDAVVIALRLRALAALVFALVDPGCRQAAGGSAGKRRASHPMSGRFPSRRAAGTCGITTRREARRRGQFTFFRRES